MIDFNVIIKTPKEFWEYFNLAGKIFSWYIIPMYYLVYMLLIIGVFVVSPFVVAWEDFMNS